MHEKWSVTVGISKQAITSHELHHTNQEHMITKTENKMYLWKFGEMELSFTPGRNEKMAQSQSDKYWEIQQSQEEWSVTLIPVLGR